MEIEVSVENVGRGIAKDVLLRVRVVRGSEPVPLKDGGHGVGWCHARREPRERAGSVFNGCIYPDDICRARKYGRREDGDWLSAEIDGRIDCDGAHPVFLRGPIPNVGGEIVLPPPEADRE